MKRISGYHFDFLESERYYPLKAYDTNTGLSLFKRKTRLNIIRHYVTGFRYGVLYSYKKVFDMLIMLSAKISKQIRY